MLALPDRPIRLLEVPPDFRLRVVASAGAGFPSPAQDWEDDALNLVELLNLDAASAFVFRVSGSSMVDAGVFDRDIVVIDRGSRPRDGAIVIAKVDGGFVCRQFVVRQGLPYIEARNAQQRYPSCLCDEAVEIWGVVRASVRDLKP